MKYMKEDIFRWYSNMYFYYNDNLKFQFYHPWADMQSIFPSDLRRVDPESEPYFDNHESTHREPSTLLM